MAPISRLYAFMQALTTKEFAEALLKWENEVKNNPATEKAYFALLAQLYFALRR
jgi:hypothetical protein